MSPSFTVVSVVRIKCSSTSYRAMTPFTTLGLITMRSLKQSFHTHCGSSCYPKQGCLWDFSERRSHSSCKHMVTMKNRLTMSKHTDRSESCRGWKSQRGRHTCRRVHAKSHLYVEQTCKQWRGLTSCFWTPAADITTECNVEIGLNKGKKPWRHI